ncbi:hypothetical protein [Asanoa iriomotensis]|uniref:Uncharacterized protein n=1 Tax=Asanoa iriomotensis TaxID=234613 RepID=A0ABQ4CB68_9ACTN|nr:hypothetical protein [Asanoa iriomotensis]GIF59560.1 hypothetical protein Air01nite_56550 [Asanoa iriomotensis]
MPWLAALLGAASIAVAGALAGSSEAAAAGSLGTLAVLAVHPAARTRLLLGGCLLALSAAVVIEHWPTADLPPNPTDLVALLTSTAWRQSQFLRQLAVAGCLFAACAAAGVAIGRSPRSGLRRPAGVAGVAALLAVALPQADLAWRSRPDPVSADDGFVQLAVMVTPAPAGPDVGAGVTVAAMLLGAALVMFACARPPGEASG